MSSPQTVPRLRRDLGTLESYAALIGILIGAGIFKITGQAWLLTGPSVILGYLVLAPAVLATDVASTAGASTRYPRSTLGPARSQACPVILKMPAPKRMPTSAP